MIRRAIALLLVMVAVPVRAALPDLTPFEATYRITVNGIPAGTAATARLAALEGTRRELVFRVQNRFFSHHERALFDWHDCRATPREYRHDFQGFGMERQSSIEFDWARRRAIETRTGTRQEILLDGEIHDGLSMAMQARCRLKSGVQPLDFEVLYRGERKPMHFDAVGDELVETAIGRYRARLLERRYPQRLRRTRVWVAEDLDWLMVRLEHVENPAARGSLLLTGLSLDGHSINTKASNTAGDRRRFWNPREKQPSAAAQPTIPAAPAAPPSTPAREISR